MNFDLIQRQLTRQEPEAVVQRYRPIKSHTRYAGNPWSLPDRQCDCLLAIGQRDSHTDAAHSLGISYKTLTGQLERAKLAMGIASATRAAVMFALWAAKA